MKKAKEFILGALVGSMVMGGCVTAFGSNGTKTINAVYKNIKIVIDGKELKTDKEPFTYEGTTYLPVRAVAEAVGKEVKWDSKTQTVTLGIVDTATNESPKAVDEKTAKETVYTLSKGSYTVGKDILAGKYDLKSASGQGVLSGRVKSMPKEILAIIITDDQDLHLPKLDTYYTYSGLTLQDGEVITIEDGVTIQFSLSK